MKYAVATLIGLVSANEVEEAYMKFISKHNKSYGTREEYNFRLALFAESYKFVNEFNNMGTDDHEVEINYMSDWTHEEYKKLLGLLPGSTGESKRAQKFDLPIGDLPASVNWVTGGAVTPVKNQGQCGSCWSFSTTGGMEGAYFIKNGSLQSFSEQQFVDCATAQGNMGCNGGWPDWAYEYAETVAIDTEAEYPYTAVTGTCNVPQTGVAEVAKFTDVTVNSPTALATALVQQPVSVCIEAD